MCLAIPGKITKIYEKNGMLMGTIEINDVSREVCLSFVPEAQVGDYAIIHVGFALNLLSEQEAQETLTLLRDIASSDQ